MSNNAPMIHHCYAPRSSHVIDAREIDGWRLRVWSVTMPGEELDRVRFERGLALAAQSLPQPAVAAGRAGAGFAILHQGRGADYIILAWWARENELPLRVFVREAGECDAWRSAREDESICVWDIDIIKRERDAWVRTVLAHIGPADVEGYLSAAP